MYRFHREPLTFLTAATVLTAYCCASCGSSSEAAKDAPMTPVVTKKSVSGKDLSGASGGKGPASGAAASETAAAGAAPRKFVFEKPKVVKGIYLTAWSAGSSRKMAKMLDMLDRTELNAVVIDIRDTGDMYFKTGIPLADESHATMVAVANPEKLFEKLEKHKVWPIARIACFRDNWVPKKFPELAVQLKGGRVWKDRSGHSWLDPYNKKNWDYIGQTVDFALKLGFPEIQLDYVRFPSEGKSSSQVFPGRKSYPDPKAKPEDVISAFAKFIGEKVRAHGAVFSADIFGIISSTKGDEGIGQELEKVAAPFDVISPMVYPSHFAKGEYGIADPDRSPYEILTKSLGDYKKRLPQKSVRPWLQDFSLRNHYGPEQVRAQIKAAKDLGYSDFLLWNAGNRYTEAALEKRASPVVAADATPAVAPAGNGDNPEKKALSKGPDVPKK